LEPHASRKAKSTGTVKGLAIMTTRKHKPEQQVAFEHLLRGVLKTSHSELKAKLDEEKKQKTKTRKHKSPSR
jgi:hypothetical protein